MEGNQTGCIGYILDHRSSPLIEQQQDNQTNDRHMHLGSILDVVSSLETGSVISAPHYSLAWPLKCNEERKAKLLILQLHFSVDFLSVYLPPKLILSFQCVRNTDTSVPPHHH